MSTPEPSASSYQAASHSAVRAAAGSQQLNASAQSDKQGRRPGIKIGGMSGPDEQGGVEPSRSRRHHAAACGHRARAIRPRDSLGSRARRRGRGDEMHAHGAELQDSAMAGSGWAAGRCPRASGGQQPPAAAASRQPVGVQPAAVPLRTRARRCAGLESRWPPAHRRPRSAEVCAADSSRPTRSP